MRTHLKRGVSSVQLRRSVCALRQRAQETNTYVLIIWLSVAEDDEVELAACLSHNSVDEDGEFSPAEVAVLLAVGVR